MVLHQKTATKNYKLDYNWNQAKQNYILKPCYQKGALSFCDNDYVIRELSNVQTVPIVGNSQRDLNLRMSCNFDLHCIPPLKGVLVPPPWKFLSQTKQVSDCVHYQCATLLRRPPGGWFLAPVSKKLIGKNFPLDSAISLPNTVKFWK